MEESACMKPSDYYEPYVFGFGLEVVSDDAEPESPEGEELHYHELWANSVLNYSSHWGAGPGVGPNGVYGPEKVIGPNTCYPNGGSCVNAW